jgi:Ca2+-binding RTX toxin-like protein
VIDLAAGTAQDGFGGTDTLANIQMLRGTHHGDTIRGDEERNVFRGLGGADLIDGRGGRDMVRHDRDARDGGPGDVIVDLSQGYAIDGWGNRDTLIGIEEVMGGVGDDRLIGDDGDNWLDGFDGDDTLIGGAGADGFRGGDGFDTVDYSTDAAAGGTGGITLDSVARTLIDPYGDTDNIDTTVERIIATAVADFIDLSATDFDAGAEPVLVGLAGNDTLTGHDTAAVTLDYRFDAEHGGTAGITVNLLLGTVTDGFGDTDTVEKIRRFKGTDAADTLIAGDAPQEFYGEGGDDSIVGGTAHDYIRGGPGDDTIDGGPGLAQVSYNDWDRTQGATVNLIEGIAFDGLGGTDTLSRINWVRGSRLADEIIGNAARNYIRGGDGADTLDGGSSEGESDGSRKGRANDVLRYETDARLGGAGPITVDLIEGYAIDGWGNRDTIRGFEDVRTSEFDDVVIADGRDNVIETYGGNDRIEVPSGIASVRPGSGNDTIIGGETFSILLQYRGFSEPLTVDLAAGTAVASGKQDTLEMVYRVEGGDGIDTLLGSDAAYEAFDESPGGDHIDGRGGFDELIYNIGDHGDLGIVMDFTIGTVRDTWGETDTFTGIEAVRATLQADRVTGSDQPEERYRLLAGADTVDGGGGIDLIDHSRDAVYGGSAGVTVDLGAGYAIDGWGDRDSLAGIEEVIGTEAADRLIGDAGANLLEGLGGDDTLQGGGGDDTLDAGDGGRDLLIPGAGADLVRLRGGEDVVMGTYADLLGDRLEGFGPSDQIVLLDALGAEIPVLLHAVDGVMTVDSGGVHPSFTLEIGGGTSFDRRPPLAQPTVAFEQTGFVAYRVLEGDEGTTTVTIPIMRSGDMTEAVTVAWSVSGAGSAPADAADFGGTLPSGTVTLPPGEGGAIIFDISGDTEIEGNELFAVSIDSALTASGLPARRDGETVLGRIRNDDHGTPLTVTPVAATVSEADDAVQFRVTRPAGTEGQALTVDYRLVPDLRQPVDDTDLDGPEGGLGSVTIPADALSALITLPLIDDTTPEPDEVVVLRLLAHTGPDGVIHSDVHLPPAHVTIVDDDTPLDAAPPAPPDGLSADAFGDPHLVTLDGLGYSFQAVGEFALVTSGGARDGASALPPLDVQIRTAPQAGSEVVSVITAVATTLGRTRLMLEAGAPPRVDDAAAAFGTGPGRMAVGDGDLYFDGTVYTVVYATGEQMVVEAFGDFLNVATHLSEGRAVAGLLGDADGDPANDLQLRDGSVLPTAPSFAQLYGAYADAWRVTPTDSLFTYAPGAGTADHTDLSFPRSSLTAADLPAALREAAEAEARAQGVTDEKLLAFAALDMALTGDPRMGGAAAGAAAPAAKAVSAAAPEAPSILGISVEAAEVTEGDAAVFTIYRLGPAEEPVAVHWHLGGTVDAFDLGRGGARSGSLMLEPGQRAQAVTVPVRHDREAEGDETLTLGITLGDEVAGDIRLANATASVRVLNDDRVRPHHFMVLDEPRGRHVAREDMALEVETGTGAYVVAGGAADDRIGTTGAASLLIGGPGDDVIRSRGGSTVMQGGPGADTFVFERSAVEGGSIGTDLITDFSPGLDRIALEGFDTIGSAADLVIRMLPSGAGLLILDDNHRILVRGLEGVQLEQSDVLIV